MHKTQYNKYPIHSFCDSNKQAKTGWNEILEQIKLERSKKDKYILVMECYPGVDEAELCKHLQTLDITLMISSISCAMSSVEIDDLLAPILTEDRVFGKMDEHTLIDYFVMEKIQQTRMALDQIKKGLILVYGLGASLITKGDMLIYADLSRWEIQLRYRKGLGNWNCKNEMAPTLSKYKRGFFAEWRWADRQKEALFEEMDYILDANHLEHPSMVTGEQLRSALKALTKQPFRTVPYFDPGVWGGQWMKTVCDLDPNESNFAWSFDGVPEENSLLLQFGDVVIEIPAMDLVLYQPQQLLGNRVYHYFGAEFPIRFDLLDTMEGENLSLQVHPLKSYIKEHFNMNYTQDESYYILDAKEDACVYLGVKTDLDKESMIYDLKEAELGNKSFPTDTYINQFPVKKHDHVLIPSGTIHCSGKNTMVLEISATPYIFTFKLWDWDRLGLDGLPRPIHLDHGIANINWQRDTNWVLEELLHQEKTIQHSKLYKEEITGLHELEFIETRRYTFCSTITLLEDESVHMLNLVDGEQAIITSANQSFEPFIVHYAETFIIPAQAGTCHISPDGPSRGKTIQLLLATIKQNLSDYME